MSRIRSGSRGTDPEAPVVSLRQVPSDKSKLPVSPSVNSVRRTGQGHGGQARVDRVAEEQRVELLGHQSGDAEFGEQCGDWA